jgi:hypothetical protein
MQAYKFFQLAGELVAVLDTGKYDGLTINDAKEAIRRGRVRELFARFVGDIDVSIIEDADWREMTDEWQGYENAIDERRKMGLSNRGVCLLIAYSLMSYRERDKENALAVRL